MKQTEKHYLSTPAENGIIIRLPNGDDKLAEQVQALVQAVLGDTVAFEVTHHNGQKKSIRVKVDYKQWVSLTKGLKALGYTEKHWNSPAYDPDNHNTATNPQDEEEIRKFYEISDCGIKVFFSDATKDLIKSIMTSVLEGEDVHEFPHHFYAEPLDDLLKKLIEALTEQGFESELESSLI